MKHKPRYACFLIAAFVFCLAACSNDNLVRNPFLPEYNFRHDINLNLPLYSPLTNTGNAIYIPTEGVGLRGVFVINAGFGAYRAFEAACPNHPLRECSTMELDGQVVECPCDGFTYSVFTGQQLDRPDDGNRYYDMLEYRVSQSGSVLLISN